MRDFSFVVVATVLAGVLSVWFAPIGSVVASGSPASSVAVELLLPLVVLLVGGVILAFSRVRQLRHEVRRRLQAEDELQRFFALAPDLLCIAGTDGYFKRVNASFTRILGYREDELLGAPFGDFVHEDDRAATNAEVEKLAQGIPTVHFVNRYRCADGTYRWFDWNSEPGPAHRLIFAAARDITERRKAEEDLLQAERLAAIGEAMAGLSHESRNALQRSQGFLERLAFKIQDNPAAMESIPEATVFVGEIQAAQDQLARLYERVLDYAAPIKLQYECCSLRELLDEAWEKLAANRQGRDARLFHDSPERDDTCWVDEHRLGQVLLNVLENSLAAAADPVEVRTAWEPAEIESRPALRISLHDSGPGFKEEERRRVFEPFFTTKTRGTGLGLAIVKRLVEAHGGEIAVDGQEGKGARVFITLPRKPA